MTPELPVHRRKKLIEVALPLEAINDASAYDTLPGIGAHPKGLHYWWARVPLPSARAVLFSSLVDDPSSDPRFAAATEEEQQRERERLFDLLRAMMPKRPHDAPEIFETAYAEVERSCGGTPPAVADPFCGGGAIPLEAHRLGLKTFAGDLNPIAVLTTRAQLEVLPRFRDVPPVNPTSRDEIASDDGWTRGRGLAADVRYYATRIGETLQQELGSHYPDAEIPTAGGTTTAPVLTWLWARTVRCPNPGCGASAPLIRSLNLSTKKKRRAWLVPVVDRDATPPTISFRVESQGTPGRTKGTIGRGGGRCLACDSPIPLKYIREQGQERLLGQQLVAIVADGNPGRVYLEANADQEHIAKSAKPTWTPDLRLAVHPQYMGTPRYGLTRLSDLFTSRQLTALATIADRIRTLRPEIVNDAKAAGMPGSAPRLVEGGAGAEAYADAIMTFLAFALDRLADFNCALSRWKPSGEQQMQLFSRQAIPMVWDFAEANVLGSKAISWKTAAELTASSMETVLVNSGEAGEVKQQDAAQPRNFGQSVLISTDPPYYDNVPYADLADFFYVWARRVLHDVHPDIFETVLVPKDDELVADTERFDGKDRAKEHFESGFRKAFAEFKQAMDPRFPLTLFYAFKQGEDEITLEGRKARSTGWETILQALVDTGFQVTATWPVSASQKWRLRAMGSNTVTSYIVLACRPREPGAGLTSRREFLSELRRELPVALDRLRSGNVAPVDLAQAAIGPGMAIFSRYDRVLSTQGDMSVADALHAIIETLDSTLNQQESDFDSDTRWAISWFNQFGMESGPYGAAETLSKAKNTSVDGLVTAGIVHSKAGKVRLLTRDELDPEWDPRADDRLTVWEGTQHLARTLADDGEQATARLLSRIGGLSEMVRDLAYQLHSIAQRKGRSDDALAFNSLIVAWPELLRLARRESSRGPDQGSLFTD